MSKTKGRSSIYPAPLHKQQLHGTLVATLRRGPHCLNIVVVLAVVNILLGPSRLERVVEPLTLSPLPLLVPIPTKPPRFCGCKATCLPTYFLSIYLTIFKHPERLVFDLAQGAIGK